MKKTLFTIMAAALALSACQKSDQPVNGAEKEEANTITVTALATNGTDTKVTMGAKAGDAYPASWNSTESTYLREVIIPTSGTDISSHYVSSSFTKQDALSGSFSFNLTAASTEGTYDYVSVYPCHPTDPKTDLENGVRYGGDDQKNRCSYNLSFTRPQVPTATGPDDSTHIYMATDMGKSAQATSLTLNYKSVVSYGKMTVKNFPALAPGETVSRITVTAPSTKIMTGRLFHYFRATAPYPMDTTIAYTTDKGVPVVRPYVIIDPQNITFNTTGFDVWFTTYPFDMVKNDILSIEVITSVKTYNAILKISKPISFQAGRVSEFTYDYQKVQPDKCLTFDFTGDPQTGWPTADNYTHTDGGKSCVYNLNSIDYTFNLADCDGASKARVFWLHDTTTPKLWLAMNAKYRYLGFPAIPGYKLVSVSGKHATTGFRSAGICFQIEGTNVLPDGKGGHGYVTGGTSKSISEGETFNYLLEDTLDNTMYYFIVTGSGIGVSSFTLGYDVAE